MIKEVVGHLPLFSLDTPNLKKPVLIVGNAYGIMPYVHPIAIDLVNNGYKPFWFAFSGQEGVKGFYSYKQGVEDINLIADYIKEKTSTLDLRIISHCAGSLFTLEYLKTFSNNSVSKLIIYGLLYTMNRRRRIAERKLKQCGVNYELSEKDWNYNPLSALSKVSIPTLFCHANDKLNLERATPEEMSLAVKSTHSSEIRWFEEGYDNNTNLITNFVPHYREFLN